MKNTYKMRKNLLGFINECLLFRTDVTEFKRLGVAIWINISICGFYTQRFFKTAIAKPMLYEVFIFSDGKIII